MPKRRRRASQLAQDIVPNKLVRTVASYDRLSKVAASSTGNIRQRSENDAVIARLWPNAEVHYFSDADESAFTRPWRERTGLMNLLSQAHGFDRMVAYNIDRVTREGIRAAFEIIDELHQRKCGLYLPNLTEDDAQSVDTSGPTGGIMLAFLAHFAQMESEAISRRTSNLHAYLRDAGGWAGVVPFGFRSVRAEPGNPKSPLKLVPDDTEAPIVVEMYERYLRGETLSDIARWLNETCPRPGDALWHSTTVRRKLLSPVNLGHQVHDEEWDRPRTWRHSQSGEIVTVGPALVAAADFRQAQRRLTADRQVGRRRQRSTDLLGAGMAQCPCGSAMYGQGSKTRGYRCEESRHRRNGCPGNMASVTRVDAVVMAFLIEGLRDHLHSLNEIEQRKRLEVAPDYDAEIERVGELLRVTGEEHLQARRKYGIGHPLVDPLANEVQELTERYDSLMEQREAVAPAGGATALIAELGLEDPGAAFAQSSREVQQRIVKLALQPVRIGYVAKRGGSFDRDRVAVFWASDPALG